MPNNVFGTPHGGSLDLTSKTGFMSLPLQSVIMTFLLGHLTSSFIKSGQEYLTTLLLRIGGRIKYDTADKCSLSTTDCYTEYITVCWLLVLYEYPESMESTSSVIDANKKY